jgi:hypothetical protein
VVGAMMLAAPAVAQPIHGHPQQAASANQAVVAQPIRLHNNPQMVAYPDSSKWVKPSFQCHWTQNRSFIINGLDPVLITVPGGGGMQLDISSPASSHVHIDYGHPYGGEVSGTLVLPFDITLHHTDGVIGRVFPLLGRDVIWDETGSATLPPFAGNPTGDVVKSGHFTMDPVTPILGADGQIDPLRSAPPRGFFAIGLVARVYFTSGDVLEAGGYSSLYSVKDPTAPERGARAGGRLVNTQCGPVSARLDGQGGSDFGTAVAEYSDWLPVAPIQAPWVVPFFPYNYAAGTLPIGSFEQRFDANFHQNIKGSIVRPPTALNGNASFVTIPYVFDPAIMGSGDHKMLGAWTQTRGIEQLSALVVWPVTVGPGVPPPTTCTDPTAPNSGGPLPCLPPVVVPTWTTLPGVFQQNGAQFRFCKTPTQCDGYAKQ